MAEFLIYDLKVAVLIAAFYFCYRLLMERETMHRLNRIVLLSSILLSLLLPLCVITLHKTIEVEQIPVIDTAELVITELGESEGQVHDWVKDRHHATSPLDSLGTGKGKEHRLFREAHGGVAPAVSGASEVRACRYRGWC